MDYSNIKISKKTHKKLKIYCAKNDLTFDKAIKKLVVGEKII